MCCGKKNIPPKSMRQTPTVGETVQLRYLGSDLATTWQTPARHTYRVDIQEPTITVDVADVPYFITRTERGRTLFAVVPAPQPTIEPVIEIVEHEPVATELVIEEITEAAMSVSDEQIADEVVEALDEVEKPSRKRKKS